MKSRVIFAAIVAASVISVPIPVLADVRKGVDAWTQGDFAAAVREWRPLADAGDADEAPGVIEHAIVDEYRRGVLDRFRGRRQGSCSSSGYSSGHRVGAGLTAAGVRPK